MPWAGACGLSNLGFAFPSSSSVGVAIGHTRRVASCRMRNTESGDRANYDEFTGLLNYDGLDVVVDSTIAEIGAPTRAVEPRVLPSDLVR